MPEYKRPSADELYDAYVYLLDRYLVIRQEVTDLAEAGVDYNVIKYNPVGSADFVNPNLDVAYLEAWIAVDANHPAVLTVPKIDGRYYTAQLLDEWAEVITNINERSFPDSPSGEFVLHAPGSAPPGVDAVPIALRSGKAKMLARVEIGEDLDGAIALQHGFALSGSPDVKITPPVSVPRFDNQTLLGVEIFDTAAEVLASAPEPEPSLRVRQAEFLMVADHVASGSDARAEIDERIRREVVPRLRKDSVGILPVENGWMIANVGGHYGDQYHLRTIASLVGIWANTPQEVVYYLGTHDRTGQPYAGGASYALHFPADSLPADQANAYWSIILVSVPDYRVIPNVIGRYNFNDHSGLQPEDDGSLRIDIAPDPVAGRPEANWLPSPAAGSFSLTLRLYLPTDAPVTGDWFPPPVEPIALLG